MSVNTLPAAAGAAAAGAGAAFGAAAGFGTGFGFGAGFGAGALPTRAPNLIFLAIGFWRGGPRPSKPFKMSASPLQALNAPERPPAACYP